VVTKSKEGIHLPFGWDTLFTIIGGIAVAVWGYATFVGKITDLEEKMEEANIKIEELVEKHIKEEGIRYEQMEEELSWYQKELNINPLNWGKGKKKK
jgi:membrane protein insertase Oxa1/YidC/SpoIIIJ